MMTRRATETPKELHVLQHEGLPPAEQALAVTLQGLMNTERPTILLRTGTGSFGRVLEDELRRNGVRFVEAGSVWELLARFKNQVRGGIRFRANTPSLSAATSLCAPLQAVAIEESLVERATKEGLSIIQDVRDWDDHRTLREYGKQFKRGILVEQGLDKIGHLRDFAVAQKAFTFAAGKDSAFRQEATKMLGPDALVYGWGPDEYSWVRDLSTANATGGPADWAQNLSLYQKLPEKKLRRPRRPALTETDGVHYIAFVLSDGDNIQWLTGGFVGDQKYWASPLRGTFPMTWEVSPVLADVAPQVLSYLYATAKPNDGFITGAGVPGYTFLHYQTNREVLARQSVSYLKKADLPVVSVLNANEGSLEQTIPLLSQREVDGVIYKDYAPYNRRKGEMLWHNGKPCISYRCLLWEGLMSPEEVAKTVADLPRDPKHDPQSFTLVNVHAWSYGSGGPLEAIRRAIALLPPHVRVATADQIIDALRRFKS